MALNQHAKGFSATHPCEEVVLEESQQPACQFVQLGSLGSNQLPDVLGENAQSRGLQHFIFILQQWSVFNAYCSKLARSASREQCCHHCVRHMWPSISTAFSQPRQAESGIDCRSKPQRVTVNCAMFKFANSVSPYCFGMELLYLQNLTDVLLQPCLEPCFFAE